MLFSNIRCEVGSSQGHDDTFGPIIISKTLNRTCHQDSYFLPLFVVILASCHLMVLSSYGPVILWSCHLMVVSTYGPVTLWSCQLMVLSSYGPVTLWSCHLMVLSSYGPVTLWSCHLMVLSSYGSVTLWSCLLIRFPGSTFLPRKPSNSSFPFL